MQLDLFSKLFPGCVRIVGSSGDRVMAGAREVPVRWIRNRRARRYIMRLDPDGAARVTIPRGGTPSEAQNFVERHTGWLEKQLAGRAAAAGVGPLKVGDAVMFRGESVRITLGPAPSSRLVCLGTERIQVPEKTATDDLRPVVLRHLRSLALRELPARVMELAAVLGLEVRRVMVRDQRTRWGSCSRRGTVSLNWRLVLTPPHVRDYLVVHELTHLRHMNHSRRYWAEVSRVYPGWAEAERWLKRHSLPILLSF